MTTNLQEGCRRCALGCLLAFAAMTARATVPDWTVDVHAYQYDMTAYVSLLLDYGADAVSDLSRYTIAAFCGDECRGVMEVHTAGDSQYGYLRIRSNMDSGEVITLQVYDADDDFFLPCADSLTFTSLDVLGVPSSPYLLQAESKSYVNKQVYLVLTQQIATAQATLDVAKDSVEVNCPDVAGDFAERIVAIQVAINLLNTEVESRYQALSLTYESSINTDSILNDAEQLVVDALLAQRVYDNEEAYQRLSTEIASVQAHLDAATDSIATACNDVSAAYTTILADIQAAIHALYADVTAQYADTLLTTDSNIDTADIEAAIMSTLADALLAQRVYDNDEAYYSLLALLNETQAQLDAAVDSIATSCADVADDFEPELSDLQAVIDSLLSDLTERYISIELDANSVIELNDLTAAIEAVISAAIAAQAEFTAIVRITVDSTEATSQCYTLDGKSVPGLCPGEVTIIRFSNGRTKKVLLR